MCGFVDVLTPNHYSCFFSLIPVRASEVDSFTGKLSSITFNTNSACCSFPS